MTADLPPDNDSLLSMCDRVPQSHSVTRNYCRIVEDNNFCSKHGFWAAVQKSEQMLGNKHFQMLFFLKKMVS